MEPLQAIDKIIEYSTIPGTSRHHWGTDIDIIDASKTVMEQNKIHDIHFVRKNFDLEYLQTATKTCMNNVGFTCFSFS